MRIEVSGTLLRFTDYQKEIDLEAATVREAIARLIEAHPAVQPVLFDREGNVRSTHRLFLNGDMLMRDEIDKPLAADDTISIVTAIAGG